MDIFRKLVILSHHLKEYFSDEPTRWVRQERLNIPSKSDGAKIFQRKRDTLTHSHVPSAQWLQVLNHPLLVVCTSLEEKTEMPLPMGPYHCPPPQIIKKSVPTILFMNLHKGFVRLLCSGKIVLVLRGKQTFHQMHRNTEYKYTI